MSVEMPIHPVSVTCSLRRTEAVHGNSPIIQPGGLRHMTLLGEKARNVAASANYFNRMTFRNRSPSPGLHYHDA
jgi:hypothetical protein